MGECTPCSYTCAPAWLVDPSLWSITASHPCSSVPTHLVLCVTILHHHGQVQVCYSHDTPPSGWAGDFAARSRESALP